MADPRNPRFEKVIRESFAAQRHMASIGARLARVTAGEIEIRVPFRADLTQQHGFLHAGVVTAAVDSACGYAALTLMEPGAAVLSVEFKVNLLAPARGRAFRAVGRVVRAGRTVTVVTGELLADDGVVVAIMTGTMMAVRDRPGLAD